MKCAVAILMLGGLAIPARADTWIEGELPAAVAVSSPQDDLYRPGVMPAVGVYAHDRHLALGLRLRFGALSDGPAPKDAGAKDPGWGGLVTAGAALRFNAGPAWIEGVLGGGLTGRDWVPAFEGGAGWMFHTRTVDLGPSARYVRVGARDQMDTIGAANLVLVGLDARFGGHSAPPRIVVTPPPPPIELPPPPPIEAARDQDVITDADVGCEEDAEGCPVVGSIVLHDDRIVLDDRVLFEFNRAHVRSAGRDMIKQIAAAWRAHPEWKRITVEGHADVRGTDAYNLELSQHRADNVKAQLVKDGFEATRIDAIGYGRTRPIDTGTMEAAQARNRRVEFLIDRTGIGPDVAPPAGAKEVTP